MQAHILQFPNSPGAIFLDYVRYGDHAQQLAVTAEKQRRFAGFGQLFSLTLHFIRHVCTTLYKACIAAAKGLTVPNRRQAVTGKRLKLRDFFRSHSVRLRPFQDGPCPRMLALCFQRQGVFKQFPFRYATFRQNIGHTRFAGSDGAGLIQRHDLNASRFFQRSGGFEQNAVLGAQAAAHHDRYRRSQTQCAGAADDQHGNAPCQRIAYFFAKQQPDNGGNDGNSNDRRHENARNLIGDFGDGRFGRRSIRYHLNDLRKGGVLADPSGAAFQEARLIDRGGGHAVAGAFVRRDTLTGQRSFIHRAGSFQHHAVHRNAFARTNRKHVVLLYLLHGDSHFHSVPKQMGCLGSQLHQAFQCVCGFALGTGFQCFAYGDQGQDHGGGLKVEIHHVGHDRVHIAPYLRARHGEKSVGAVNERRRRAQRHQRIHVRRTVPQALETADKEFLVDDHDDNGQKHLSQAHGHMIVIVEGGQRPAPHHMAHREVHQHQQKAH